MANTYINLTGYKICMCISSWRIILQVILSLLLALRSQRETTKKISADAPVYIWIIRIKVPSRSVGDWFLWGCFIFK